jgi:putative FmdB family regulatory protein
MPTYEYKCLECSNLFEVFQSMNAEAVKICPKCGGEVKRLISAGSGPIFKGSGFYQTDYKNNGNSKKNSSEPEKVKSPDKPKEAAPKKNTET